MSDEAAGRKINRKFSKQLEKLMNKYEQRNHDLEEREANARHRVEMMESAMPTLLAMNMFRMYSPTNIEGTPAPPKRDKLEEEIFQWQKARDREREEADVCKKTKSAEDKRREKKRKEQEEAIRCELEKRIKETVKAENPASEHNEPRRKSKDRERKEQIGSTEQEANLAHRVELLLEQQRKLKMEHQKAAEEAKVREDELKRKIESLEKLAEKNQQLVDNIRERYN